MVQDALWSSIQKGVFVIAEIGKNFIETEEEKSVGEYLENAKTLVRLAREAGADAVKFQTHTVEDEQLNIHVISPHFNGSDRYRWVTRNTRMTPVNEFWKPLKAYAEKLGIIFFSTPMSRGAAKLLNEEVGVPLFKVGSGDILDFVMLDYIRNTGKPTIISSGMSTQDEVDAAVQFIKKKNKKVALMHCVSKYPCPPEDLHLKTISFFKERYGIPVGFSDHSIGIDSALGAVALGAVALGATVIEKHFSLSRDLWGADHKVSLTPPEFTSLTSRIREVERDPARRKVALQHQTVRRGLGKTAKVLQEEEAVFRPIFRKSLVAGSAIKAGTVITSEMIYAMRPQLHAKGLPSERYESIIGKRVAKDLKKYDPIDETAVI